jgi:fructoselysine 6-kinase
MRGSSAQSATTALGLDLAQLHTLPGRTGMTLISLIDGDRQLLHEDFGVGLEFEPSTGVLAEIAPSDWVHCISMPNQPSAVRGLVDAGARVSVDLSTYHDLGSLRGVEIAFASVPGLAGADLLARSMVEAGCALAVVLCGADGSVAATATEAWQQPAMRIDVVDTCGAGDSFIARFTAARATGSGVPDALSAATEWAAQTCTHLGAFPQELRPLPLWMTEDYAGEEWFTSRFDDGAVALTAGNAS